ncbi:MAG TPA: transcriptional regulator [Cytophagales bacterium]|jgi:DNA-binding transcriptional ArsR family regulator|nr:transcriptional regulator [Cytophagales bacterium]
MGVTKAELFTTAQNEVAQIAKVLAHPARVAIIELLLNSNKCITGDIVEEIGLAQATISQHLRELKSVGIIQGTIEGTSVKYCINAERWHEIQKLFHNFFEAYVTNKDCC